MSAPNEKYSLIQSLQQEVFALQGFKQVAAAGIPGTNILASAFANHSFPVAAVHEFISSDRETAAATNGFLGALMASFLKQDGICVWVSMYRSVFPPALKSFGITPDKVVFLDVSREQDALWVIEEALGCKAVSAVVGEIRELNFNTSRRLQLAVEKSAVTGFIHRCQPRSENTVACVSRWKIRPVASEPEKGMPGIGFPRWDVQLLKVRNGRPGRWQLEWSPEGFRHMARKGAVPLPVQKTKAG